ncbi:MAG TPA: CxxC-x17-CxxC domain-containing protein [Candidatus Bipolaricaulota bacterium]|nr:CxxC-x17-CxxC domain-containing protein [Candidatus Bipolaricaulota bacterium]
MGNYQQNSRFDRKRDRKDFGGRDSSRQGMHRAICSECGKNCEVPFKPMGGKPIFCSDCFSGREPGDQKGFKSRDKQMHKAVCATCNKVCEVPFKPTGEKAVYCSDCFSKGKKSDGGGDQTQKQLETINAKLDEILKAIKPAAVATPCKNKKVVKKEKAVEKKEVVKKEKAKKPVKIKEKKTTKKKK